MPGYLPQHAALHQKRQQAMEKLSSGHCLHELIVQCLSDHPDKRPTAAGINKTMKELCVSLPKRFPSVLEMHTEIWKLHGVSWLLLYYFSVYRLNVSLRIMPIVVLCLDEQMLTV